MLAATGGRCFDDDATASARARLRPTYVEASLGGFSCRDGALLLLSRTFSLLDLGTSPSCELLQVVSCICGERHRPRPTERSCAASGVCRRRGSCILR